MNPADTIKDIERRMAAAARLGWIEDGTSPDQPYEGPANTIRWEDLLTETDEQGRRWYILK